MSPEDRDRLLALGAEAFDRGDYFAAHEHWEVVWRETAAGDARRHLKGLIQIAAALHKHAQGHADAARALLAKAARTLAGER